MCATTFRRYHNGNRVKTYCFGLTKNQLQKEITGDIFYFSMAKFKMVFNPMRSKFWLAKKRFLSCPHKYGASPPVMSTCKSSYSAVYLSIIPSTSLAAPISAPDNKESAEFFPTSVWYEKSGLTTGNRFV